MPTQGPPSLKEWRSHKHHFQIHDDHDLAPVLCCQWCSWCCKRNLTPPEYLQTLRPQPKCNLYMNNPSIVCLPHGLNCHGPGTSYLWLSCSWNSRQACDSPRLPKRLLCLIRGIECNHAVPIHGHTCIKHSLQRGRSNGSGCSWWVWSGQRCLSWE